MHAKRAGDNVPGVGIAGAVIALACCAGLPAAAAFIGGLTFAALLGVAGGVLALAGVVAAVVRVARVRRRHAQPPGIGRPTP